MNVKIYLPWKTKGHDGRYYKATLDIVYSNTQIEELNSRADSLAKEKNEFVEIIKHKREKAGLRNCPGHKFPKVPTYSEEGQCSICGGYLK